MVKHEKDLTTKHNFVADCQHFQINLRKTVWDVYMWEWSTKNNKKYRTKPECSGRKWSWSPGRQPAGDSHKPGGGMLLLSARPTVTAEQYKIILLVTEATKRSHLEDDSNMAKCRTCNLLTVSSTLTILSSSYTVTMYLNYTTLNRTLLIVNVYS